MLSRLIILNYFAAQESLELQSPLIFRLDFYHHLQEN